MRFQCPICKGIVSVEDTEMGTTVQCGHCNNPVTVPSSRTASGSVIGDFIILHELGRGGMGIVYLAHQISLDRPAAVKILSESYAKNSDFVVGFIKEARAAAKLNHPNIVQAYAVGDDDGIFYFAMEHVDGETMKHILKRENVIPVKKAIDIVRQIAEALDYAWQEEKLVHRDIKPDNIMLTSAGRAKLADLGLAKVGNDPGSTEGEEVMGTPQYISPEQLTGDALDNRTDIYCLGATFYHFLTGRFPYEGSSAVEIARQHLDGTLIPPNQVNPAIPETVSRVVEKMMAKDPAQRYQSAGQLAEDLARIKRGQNPAVATVSGSIRVQSSNKDEAAHKVIPPKLRMPGRPAAAGTETIVDVNTAQRSAPKLSFAGKNNSTPSGVPASASVSKAVPP
ncbi:MAG: protein kinase [Lentisphaeria bacterium]|nr:protein kinase [Lentisphaeria bacterium]